MAKAITNIEKRVPDQAEEEAQAIQQLLKATANQSAPLLKFLDILNELDQLGVLEAIQAMLKNKQQIALIGLGQMNKPGATRIIKNGMGAAQLLAQLDPSKLGRIMNGVATGVDYAVESEPTKKQGLWSLVRTMREPEVLASLSMMTKFLQGMGKGLNKSH